MHSENYINFKLFNKEVIVAQRFAQSLVNHCQKMVSNHYFLYFNLTFSNN